MCRTASTARFKALGFLPLSEGDYVRFRKQRAFISRSQGIDFTPTNRLFIIQKISPFSQTFWLLRQNQNVPAFQL